MRTDYKKLLELLKGAKSSPCVSILLPLSNKKPDSLENFAYLKRLIKQAIEELETKQFDQGQIVIDKLEQLANEEDKILIAKGFGLFVSPELAEMAEFPSAVAEKVIVDDSFEVRDIVYSLNQQLSYWFVLVAYDEIKLFKGEGQSLTPVEDENFPYKFVDDYQHEPTPNRTGEGVEDSTLKKKRREHFYEQAEHRLEKYLAQKKEPVVLAGLEENISIFFKKVKTEQVILQLSGNYHQLSMSELQDALWPEIEQYLHGQQEKHLKELEESPFILTDLQDIWQAVIQGNGNLLLVERDYKEQAYIQDDFLVQHLDNGSSRFEKHVDDLVDDIIEQMLKIKGKVVFVDNDRLSKYGHIALIPRYSQV